MEDKGIILFVEDRVDDFEIAIDILRIQGESREIERCSTLASAIARVRQGGVALVILDLSLPDVESQFPLDTLKIFEAECPDAKVLVYTASSWIAGEIEKRQHKFVGKDRPEHLRQAIAEELRIHRESDSSILKYRMEAVEQNLVEIAKIRDEIGEIQIQIAQMTERRLHIQAQDTHRIDRLEKKIDAIATHEEYIEAIVPLGRALCRFGFDQNERDRHAVSLAQITPILVYAQKKPLIMAVFVVFGFLLAVTFALFLSSGKVEVFKWIIDFIRHAIKIIGLTPAV